ncbi:MAG: DUF115 domain-containing protein [Desulfurococcaceae archaeon]|jgi:uncharacterized Rossmann fold enzyme|nr:DUF115 domain-containing protein [Desulfurococcaceae archaeon]
MNLRDPLLWEHLYGTILTSLGLSREGDFVSCRLLDALLSTRVDLLERSLRRLSELLVGRDVIVVGDFLVGPCPKLPSATLVAADSAFAKCVERGVVPEVLVTDLDGVTVRHLKFRDVVYVVHAHGDNYERLLRLVPEVEGYLVGTAQCKCSERVQLFGGFTDGDRAAYLAYYMGATRVLLYGFNFSQVTEVVKPSGISVNPRSKLAKLSWARYLLFLLRESGYRVECLGGTCEGWL